jgi:hypothetical protein
MKAGVNTPFLRRIRSCVQTWGQVTISLSMSSTCRAMMMCGSRDAGGDVSGRLFAF